MLILNIWATLILRGVHDDRVLSTQSIHRHLLAVASACSLGSWVTGTDPVRLATTAPIIQVLSRPILLIKLEYLLRFSAHLALELLRSCGSVQDRSLIYFWERTNFCVFARISFLPHLANGSDGPARPSCSSLLPSTQLHVDACLLRRPAAFGPLLFLAAWLVPQSTARGSLAVA